jgi:magnesium transporter
MPDHRPDRSAVVNCAIYEAGRKVKDADIDNPADMVAQSGRVIWIGLHEPTHELLLKLQAYFGLHELAIEDAYRAHQRPKVEVYGETLFVVMKTVQEVDDEFQMGETCFFVGRGYVLTIRHGPSTSYAPVRKRCESAPSKLKDGEDFILYALMDFIVDNYFPLADHLEEQVEEIEEMMLDLASDHDTLSAIVGVRRRLMALRHAVAPLPEICQRLMRFDMKVVDHDTHPYFRDVYDHTQILLDRIENLRETMNSVVETKMLLASSRQNEVTRKLAAWAAMLAVPTAIAGIYGMNFEHMPELGWIFGYPLVMAVIFGICGVLYWRFKRSGWL